MKKSLLGSLLLSLTLCFLIGAVGTVSAETDLAPPPPGDRAPDSARQSIDVHTHTDRSTAGADLIKLWSCGIEDNGDGSVYIMGETRTYRRPVSSGPGAGEFHPQQVDSHFA
jgi:hypothetical protein